MDSTETAIRAAHADAAAELADLRARLAAAEARAERFEAAMSAEVTEEEVHIARHTYFVRDYASPWRAALAAFLAARLAGAKGEKNNG